MPSGLAGLLAFERKKIAAGEATVCGYTCADHGNHVCERAQHPDVPDNRTPHIADVTGVGLVQWTGPCVVEGAD